MNLNNKELALVISALEGDRQGTWGDDRRENLNKIINKLKAAKLIDGYTCGEALAGVNCQICRVILTEETAATAGILEEWGETCLKCIIKLEKEGK